MKHDRDRESKAFFDFSSREFGQRLPKRHMETSVNRAKEIVHQLGTHVFGQPKEQRGQRTGRRTRMPQDGPQVGVEDPF